MTTSSIALLQSDQTIYLPQGDKHEPKGYKYDCVGMIKKTICICSINLRSCADQQNLLRCYAIRLVRAIDSTTKSHQLYSNHHQKSIFGLVMRWPKEGFPICKVAKRGLVHCCGRNQWSSFLITLRPDSVHSEDVARFVNV